MIVSPISVWGSSSAHQLTEVPFHYGTFHAVTCLFPYPAEQASFSGSLSVQGDPISVSGAVPLQRGGLLERPSVRESSKIPVIAPLTLSVDRVLSTVYGTGSGS